MHGDANALKALISQARVQPPKGLWQKIESDQGPEEKPPANFGLAAGAVVLLRPKAKSMLIYGWMARRPRPVTAVLVTGLYRA